MVTIEDLSYLDLLNKTSIPLRKYLEANLRKIEREHWWTDLVINTLPDYYTRQIDVNAGGLDELDIAALLKVFDANWRELSEVTHLDWVLRNYVKELQTIRNIWAHQTKTVIATDVLERHLSTLELFCKGIEADDVFIRAIQDKRNAILYENIALQTLSSANSNIDSRETDTNLQKNLFSIGEQVSLKSDMTFRGIVIEVSSCGEETRYKIFGNNKNQTYYHSQLSPVHESDKKSNLLSLDEFKAMMTVIQIQNPNSSTLYSLNSAKIDMIPHQFRPVLKFIKSDRPRILIADGVGVGKTIEAGLILKELQARMNLESVLIICPKPLITERKWRDEMRLRFGELFEALDGKQFREAVKDASYDEWADDKKRIILPYSLLVKENLEKNKTYCGLFNLENPPRFNLVIVDEAHHIRNSNTLAYKGVEYFIKNADAVVLLTATPIQLGDQDLFTLLNLIRPDLVPDIEVFRIMSEPNPYITEAAGLIRAFQDNWQKKTLDILKQAEKTSWGRSVYPENPEYRKAVQMMEQEVLSETDRVSLLSTVESLHTFASILSRTRRRDIGEYAIRKTQTVSVPMTVEQKQLYERILEVQSEILSHVHEDTPIGFMISTLQRRAASSLFGLIPFLDDILTRHLDELDFAECDIQAEGVLDFESISDEVKRLIADSEALAIKDPKYDRMVEILREKSAGPSNKVMLFSSFRHTLGYLYNRLTDDGFRVGMIHGGVRDDDRRHLRDLFKLSPEDLEALDILLFSEVGCEGLDYQFCDCMINYDLPWNPMKIEQRIGRIDRTGQKSEYVSIFNMITPDTVDAEIYNRCFIRIGVFERAIGDNEEILGEICSDIQRIAENFRLNEMERQAKLSQLADNKIRKYLEQENLERERPGLFGLDLSKMQMKKEIEDATSWWMSPENMENMLEIYLRKRFGTEREYLLGEKSEKSLRLSSESRDVLYGDFRAIPNKPEYKKWEKWLRGQDKERKAYYPLSFAAESTGVGELITPVHPFVRQAVAYLRQDETATTVFSVMTNDLPAGEYPFAVYLWTYAGIHQEQVLQSVALSDVVAEHLFVYIQNGISVSEKIVINEDVERKLEDVHYVLWKQRREEHIRITKEMIHLRTESLQRSYEARMRSILDQLETTTNENIRKMKGFELHNVEGELKERLQEIEKDAAKADIASNVVVHGILIVHPAEEMMK